MSESEQSQEETPVAHPPEEPKVQALAMPPQAVVATGSAPPPVQLPVVTASTVETSILQMPLLTLLTAYAFTVSILYLFGFWSAFRINILEYATFSNVINLALYPILVSCGITYGSQIIVDIAASYLKNDDQERFIVTTGSRRNVILSGTVFILGMIWTALDKTPFRYVIMGNTISLAIFCLIPDFPFLAPYLKTWKHRSSVMIVVLLALGSAFGYGRVNAEKIISGPNPVVISTRLIRDNGIDEFNLRQLVPQDDYLKYIGRVGDYIFLLGGDNKAVYCYKYENLYLLKFESLDDLRPPP